MKDNNSLPPNSEKQVPLSPQEQCDSTTALLCIQELVDASVVTITGTIDVGKCRALLADFKSQGIHPNEERASKLGVVLGRELGIRLTGRKPRQ